MKYFGEKKPSSPVERKKEKNQGEIENLSNLSRSKNCISSHILVFEILVATISGMMKIAFFQLCSVRKSAQARKQCL